MSTAVIDYGSMKSAAGAAGKTARRMDSYASEIKSALVKRLNNYDGPKGGNVNEAVSQLNKKISQMEARAEQYRTYETDLKNVKEECVKTDDRVKTKVSSLTTSFRQSHGISNNKIINGISYVLTSFANITGIGRWVSDVNDWMSNGWDYLKGVIKDWYKYDGGKYLIGESVLAVCTAALAVIAAIGAIALAAGAATIGAIVVAVAAALLAVTAVGGAIVNIVNNVLAYNKAQNKDPAAAKRLDRVNTIQDWLRGSDEQWKHTAAGILDVCELVANVITIVDSVGTLLKKGYIWVGNRRMLTKNFKWSQHASWAEFKSGISRITGKAGVKLKNLFADVKLKKWDNVKVTMQKTLKWEYKNMKTDYLKKLEDLKKIGQGSKETREALKIGITWFEKGFAIGNSAMQDDWKEAGNRVYNWVENDILSGLKTKTYAHRNDFSMQDIKGKFSGINKQIGNMRTMLNLELDSLKSGTKGYNEMIRSLKNSASYQYSFQ